MNPHDDDVQLDDEIEVEAYCVRCRDTITMIDPHPVWTRKGLPATRGECPTCGGSVFRLGKSDAHDLNNRPDAVVVDDGGRKRAKLPKETVYINFHPDDAEFAEQLAADLEKMGVGVWLHDVAPSQVEWAGGRHPALDACSRMVLILSPAVLGENSVQTAWTYFREKRKPVAVAQIAPAETPDPLRRSPRFDFNADYKLAFRELLQVLNQ